MVPAPPPEILAAVAQQIKKLRVARGLTQDAVADSLGIALKNVQRLESGRQNLTLLTLQSVADVLDVEPQELLALAVDPNEQQASTRRALRGLGKHGHRVVFSRTRPKRDYLPLFGLQAAASHFGHAREVEVTAWIKLRGVSSNRLAGRFIAQVEGRSMQPTVPHGALALFKAPVTGPLEGRVVLAEWREPSDPDTGGAYAVKRVGAVEGRKEGGIRLSLLSDNSAFPPIVVEGETTGELRIIAELERVLWPIKS